MLPVHTSFVNIVLFSWHGGTCRLTRKYRAKINDRYCRPNNVLPMSPTFSATSSHSTQLVKLLFARCRPTEILQQYTQMFQLYFPPKTSLSFPTSRWFDLARGVRQKNEKRCSGTWGAKTNETIWKTLAPPCAQKALCGILIQRPLGGGHEMYWERHR